MLLTLLLLPSLPAPEGDAPRAVTINSHIEAHAHPTTLHYKPADTAQRVTEFAVVLSAQSRHCDVWPERARVCHRGRHTGEGRSRNGHTPRRHTPAAILRH
ncbi:unnamed protein product [Arctia plantaginis]|uniref:Secreted protein n=1 Tax=Arctia plantaginis TaxID=874455 RepID=A0A8S0YPQ4_ARCPL|nr:unnamed protein product [Arctia plantaginis]CAB3235621.1 unnamed protein product [Arctia plantaginis]